MIVKNEKTSHTQWLFVMEITILGYHKRTVKILISRYERISWCIFGDAFKKSKEVLNKPIMFTEFGADALT
jgi:hypothetical protein